MLTATIRDRFFKHAQKKNAFKTKFTTCELRDIFVGSFQRADHMVLLVTVANIDSYLSSPAYIVRKELTKPSLALLHQ